MKKIDAIGMDDIKEDLITKLMDLGMMQMTDQSRWFSSSEGEGTGELLPDGVDKDGNDEAVTALDAEISRINTALDTLDKYGDAKHPLFHTRRSVARSEFSELMKNRGKISGDVDHVMELAEKLHGLQEKINKTHTDLASLGPWVTYDVPLEDCETQHTVTDLGIIPAAADVDAITKTVIDEHENVYIREIGRDKDMVYMLFLSMKEDRGVIMDFIKQRGYTPMPMKGFSGTVAENIERMQEEIGRLEEQLQGVQNEIGDAYPLHMDIECLGDQLVIERDHEKAKSGFLKTKRTFCLEGWIPAPVSGAVEKLLESEGCWFGYREPEPEEEIPVMIQTNTFSKPFSAVTDMYSLPDYKGFDPTNIFSVFYALFFGIMLSDAGYGLVMTVGCFIILKKFDLEGMTGKMIRMFMICGIATMFWGVMFGGFFGDLIQTWGSTVFDKEIVINAVWFSPMEDPTRLLIFSLLFGVIHLFVGMGIHAYMMIKRGKPMDAVCDVFSWYLVIIGAGLWIGGSSISAMLVTPGKYIFIAGMAILLLTGGRKNKGIVGKITGGLSAVYGITGYISDILSYARLLALGLATGVIATVVNLLGSMIGTGLTGAIALVLIGIVGHIFSMAINILGAFVHSSRLQYVEFFGKFYEDGGEPFAPLDNDTKYIKLVEDQMNRQQKLSGGNNND
ncbi:MAG: V-type ATP synthase subunit I [Eubacteriaceae bacterium]|nr:V-type ATP synthase subunit I [Eubacteriaceae bacterium]